MSELKKKMSMEFSKDIAITGSVLSQMNLLVFKE